MTESSGNELSSALFARIRQMVSERGVDIRQHLNGNSLKLEFADGQRILVNCNLQTHSVWLASRSGGVEFAYSNGNWRAHDQSEFFARLHEVIEQTIAADPLNARAPTAQTQHTVAPVVAIRPPDETRSHLLRNLLILLLTAGVGFWAAQRLNQPGAGDHDADGTRAHSLPLNQLNQTASCEATLPASGNITVFPGSGLRADGPNDPLITLKNDRAYPLLLILSAPQTAVPAVTLLVDARQSASLHLPAGQYDMMFSSGNTWCNARNGFTDGHLLKFDQPLTVQMEKPVQLAVQSSGAGIDDYRLFVRTDTPETPPPAPTFSGDGSMEVKRAANGHFYLPGSIENVPVTFIVDTGASVTSVSSSIARQAGIRDCKEMQFQTANGAANGCIALVQRMTLGNFTLQNITVAVMPNMETNLLGANVLRNFKISQDDGSMLLGLR